jgi:glutamine amidotransferase
MNCNTPTDIVFSFTGFSERGGRTDEHKDGWGIAFFEEQGVRHFIDDKPAVESALAEMIKTHPIKSKNVIAHIRKATQGETSLQNCHPFIREAWGQEWVFAHNGDLKSFAPVLDGSYLPTGNTDSELAFCFLMQSLTKKFGVTAPGINQVRKFLKKFSAEVASHGTFNFTLSNGDALYVHCSTKLHYVERQYPFTTAALNDENVSIDFSKVTTPQDRVALIVTEPLTSNETWTAFQAGELKVFVDGRALPELTLNRSAIEEPILLVA